MHRSYAGNKGPKVLGYLVLTVLLLASYEQRPHEVAAQPSVVRRVNAPYSAGEVDISEMAVFWFGHVDPTSNFADVRVGYSSEYLSVRVAVFDRRLWYDAARTGVNLTDWDAATLCLDVGGDGGSVPASDDYRFEAQVTWWEQDWMHQAAFQGNGAGWAPAAVPFTAVYGWRGNVPNDDVDDRGWQMHFKIPFASLGTSAPPQGTVWRMALVIHDRDDAAGTPIGNRVWPEAMDTQQPSTWGELAFGMPTYDPPSAVSGDVVTVRQGLDGASVVDGHVGGGTVCGAPYAPNYFDGWGDANYDGAGDISIGNGFDVADWPCFSKYYVTFPLGAVPADKAIISATLTLYQFGNAGDPGQAEPSLIQVLTVAEEWDETTLTWNNAPLAVQNTSAAWAYPLLEFPGWPGVPVTWDVSLAAAEAYEAGIPLRLALYEADYAYHSTKYFVSSDSTIEEGRPTLRVLWGDRVGAVDKTPSSTAVDSGDLLTYTLTVVGSGQPLTLTDELPAGVSAPVTASPVLSYVPHRLSWSGTPGLAEAVVLTYAVTVTAASHTALWNQAVLTDSGILGDVATSLVFVDPDVVHLPWVTKQ